MAIRKPITDLLQAFEVLHGPHPSKNPDATARVWDLACRRFTDEQIIKATEPLLTKKTFGWPKPSDLAECIEGVAIPLTPTQQMLANLLKRYESEAAALQAQKDQHDIPRISSLDA